MDETLSPTTPRAKRRPRNQSAPVTRVSKIARLPYETRLEINRRLLNGDTAADIVAWLNVQPEIKARLAEYFHGRPVNEQNVSVWRAGGYVE